MGIAVRISISSHLQASYEIFPVGRPPIRHIGILTSAHIAQCLHCYILEFFFLENMGIAVGILILSQLCIAVGILILSQLQAEICGSLGLSAAIFNLRLPVRQQAQSAQRGEILVSASR